MPVIKIQDNGTIIVFRERSALRRAKLVGKFFNDIGIYHVVIKGNFDLLIRMATAVKAEHHKDKQEPGFLHALGVWEEKFSFGAPEALSFTKFNDFERKAVSLRYRLTNH